MSGVQMVSDVRQTYNGRAILRDEIFEATSEAEAADLIAVRVAHRVKPVAKLLEKQVPVAYVTKVMEAATATTVTEENIQTSSQEPESEVPSAAAVLDKKDGYNRRDMRAKR